MTYPSPATIKNEKILIDSCVLLYCGDQVLGPGAKKILRTLADNKCKLTISDISLFEVLKNCFDHKNFDYYRELLVYLAKLKILRQYLMNAAKLGHMYAKGRSNQPSKDDPTRKEIHTGDLIIAGSAIYHGALVLTSDRQGGFPFKHWEIVARESLIDSSEPKTRVIDVYLLRFKNQASLPDGFLTLSNDTDGKISLAKVRGPVLVQGKQ